MLKTYQFKTHCKGWQS